MGGALLVTSGKGGVGKSTVAAGLALAFRARDLRVALVDADTGLRSLDVLLGAENRVVYDLCDVAEGVCRLKQALVRVGEGDGLCLMAAAQTRDDGAVSPAAMERVVNGLAGLFDRVILDCPAGVGRGFQAAAYACERAVVVAQGDAVSVRDAERVMGLLERHDILSPALLMNRVRREDMAGELSPARVAERLSARLIGVVPEDAAMRRMPLDPRCAALRALSRVAARLEGEEIPLPEAPADGFVQRLMRRLRPEKIWLP